MIIYTCTGILSYMYSIKIAKKICFSPFLKIDKDGDFDKSNGSELNS